VTEGGDSHRRGRLPRIERMTLRKIGGMEKIKGGLTSSLGMASKLKARAQPRGEINFEYKGRRGGKKGVLLEGMTLPRVRIVLKNSYLRSWRHRKENAKSLHESLEKGGG